MGESVLEKGKRYCVGVGEGRGGDPLSHAKSTGGMSMGISTYLTN
jgi:hypothetical protein